MKIISLEKLGSNKNKERGRGSHEGIKMSQIEKIFGKNLKQKHNKSVRKRVKPWSKG